MDFYWTTARGLKRLQIRLEEARARYFEICADNEAAAGSGDSSVWHDNFAYEENQRQMHQYARKVRDLENLLAQIRLVPVTAEVFPVIRVGSCVRIAIPEEGREQTLFIAGYEDGDPQKLRVSYTTPMARALLGKSEGDSFDLSLNGKKRTIEVLKLCPPPEEERG